MKAHGWFEEEYNKVVDTEEFLLSELEIKITEEIVKLLEENNMTRRQLADKLGITKSAVSRLLNNGSNLTLKRLISIAKALNGELNIQLKSQKIHYETIPDYPLYQLDTYRQNPKTDINTWDEMEPDYAVNGN